MTFRAYGVVFTVLRKLRGSLAFATISGRLLTRFMGFSSHANCIEPPESFQNNKRRTHFKLTRKETATALMYGFRNASRS